jgi:hypothetical protein
MLLCKIRLSVASVTQVSHIELEFEKLLQLLKAVE